MENHFVFVRQNLGSFSAPTHDLSITQLDTLYPTAHVLSSQRETPPQDIWPPANHAVHDHMMEPGGYSQDENKYPSSSSFSSSSCPVMFTHPSPPPSAHSSVDHRNHIWGLPPPRGEPPPSTTAAPSSITLPPISAFHDFTPPNTAFTFERSSLPQHLRPGSDQASIGTWITAANTDELAEDDNDFDDTNFVYENGRRYHANVEGRIMYPLPNDESEQEREDMNHKLALWMMHEKLFYAPIEGTFQQQGGTVFDLGESTTVASHPSFSLHSVLFPLRHPLRTYSRPSNWQQASSCLSG